jgi:signal transduction histidine kinase
VISKLLQIGHRKILFWIAALTAFVTLMDWITGKQVSLAAFYMVPMLVAAIILRPLQIALFSILCSYIRSWFDLPGSFWDWALRFVFAAAAYFLAGVFVRALIRNREQTLRHLEQIEMKQKLRREAEDQLQVLAANSPAAILTMDGAGVVLAANDSVRTLLTMPEDVRIIGRNVLDYLPFLEDALRFDAGKLRTAAECQAHRHDGEPFLAHIWFSTYDVPEGKRLAAIVVDSSEDLRDREEESLRQLVTGNRIASAAMAHEIGNICETMGILCEDLRRPDAIRQDNTFVDLDRLLGRLRAIACLNRPLERRDVEYVSLEEILDNLRIVVEPAWQEAEATVRWQLPGELPAVAAEPRGLLHALSNLVQNRLQVVRMQSVRELAIDVQLQHEKAVVQFQDSGPSSSDAFRPFREGSGGDALGMYVSRSIVRSFGGDIRRHPSPDGSCFIVELKLA